MLLATALALFITGCAQQTFTVQNKPLSSVQRNHHPSFLRFWIKQKKTVDAAKICGGAENVVKTETQQTFVNGLLGFITLGIYTPLEARVLLTHWWVAHRYGQLYLHCSLIYSGSFQLFLHSDQPLSEGEIIPFSGVCQSGGRLHYPRRRRWWLHALIDRLLWCATDDDQRQHHHAEHHFQL